MKTKFLFFFFFIGSFCFAQSSWLPLGSDDFNTAACGDARTVGRNPIIVKNDHVFFFNVQNAGISNENTRFSFSKFINNKWEHVDFPYTFSVTPLIDCVVNNNEIPFVAYNDIIGNNTPKVIKYEDNNWVEVGTNISTTYSNFLNICMGNDNLPVLLYQDGNIVKLKKFDGNNWILLSETSEFIPYTSISLELDNNNVPYVLTNYQVGSTYNCFVKKFNGTGWVEVGITGFSEQGGYLAFDTNNVPHLSSGNQIRKFDGSSWITVPLPPFFSYPHAVNGPIKLFFNSSNTLYIGCSFAFLSGPTNPFYIRRLVNGAWETVLSNGFFPDKVFTVSGDYAYYASVLTDYHPDILKLSVGQSELLGSTSFFLDRSSGNHDFSICNGLPMVAYKGNQNKADVAMYYDGNWMALGGINISENDINKAMIKSGTDGHIYLAYNNKISSDISDTKITVKKLTTSGWELVGPVNFSLSAGAEFDFKLSQSNEPYVLYMNGRVQKYNGTNWEYVGGSAYTGDVESRLALNTNDVPYISFINSNTITVKRWNGSLWENLEQTGLSTYPWINKPRIVIDSNNTIYVGFIDNLSRVHIKKLNNNVWESVGADLFTTSTTTNFELNVDHNNVLYATYNEVNDNRRKVKVKKYNGTDWEFVGEPNFSSTTVSSSKINFDETNTPIVSYSSVINGQWQSIYTKRFDGSVLDNDSQELSNEDVNFELIPNPAFNSFSINHSDAIQLVEIFDLTGKKVHFENTNFSSIDISHLTSGLYIVKIKSNEGTNTVKLAKN